MALSSFTSAVLYLGGRNPNKILFAKNSGKILQLDFHPMYDAMGNLEGGGEHVPFRYVAHQSHYY
jgi:phosphatidylinositol kinase/protein kinase (PI-3  family)